MTNNWPEKQKYPFMSCPDENLSAAKVKGFNESRSICAEAVMEKFSVENILKIRWKIILENPHWSERCEIKVAQAIRKMAVELVGND